MSRLATCKLNAAQVILLKTLLKASKPLTRTQLEEKAKVNPTAVNLGPSYKEHLDDYQESLYYLGYVKAKGELVGDKEVITFELTEKGEKAAKEFKAVKVTSKDYKIPGKVLDPIVKRAKKLRPYGFEHYTVNDLREILDQCGEEYSDVPLNDLKQQICNRRKQGAYSEKVSPETVWPDWYKEYRNSKSWFDHMEKVLQHSNYKCTINDEHSTAFIVVAHTNLDRLGEEKVKDCITLCEECWRRNYKHLPQIPEDIPGVIEC